MQLIFQGRMMTYGNFKGLFRTRICTYKQNGRQCYTDDNSLLKAFQITLSTAIKIIAKIITCHISKENEFE